MTEDRISGEKTTITVFFTATRLIIFNSLPQGQSFTQDDCIAEVIPVFTKEKLEISGSSFRVLFLCT
jgi:hypothetical protein